MRNIYIYIYIIYIYYITYNHINNMIHVKLSQISKTIRVPGNKKNPMKNKNKVLQIIKTKLVTITMDTEFTDS